MTLPTGGSISYSYSGGSNGITCADGTTATLTRAVNDNIGHNSQWTYAHSENGTAWTTTVSGPQSYSATYNFQGILETERQIAGLTTVYTCYGSSGNPAPAYPCNNNTVGLPITQRVVTSTFGNVTSQVVTDYDPTYTLPTETDEYDWGPTLVRKTLTAYDFNNSCGVTNAYVKDRPCSLTVENGSGGTVASVSNTFDANGNLTQASSDGLTRKFSYNSSNGTVATSTDVNGTVTNYYYNGTGGCANAFVTGTSVTVSPGDGLTLTTSAGWNCNSGEMTSSTDFNGNTTTYTYSDVFNRLTQVNYPDGGETTTSYSDSPPYPLITSQNLIQSGVWSNSSQISHDGLGRVVKVIGLNSAGVDLVYDGLGRVQYQSNPYWTASDPTFGQTQYNYDALGRLTQTTHPDNNHSTVSYSNNCATYTDEAGNQRTLCSDGLGRLNYVADPDGTTHYHYDVLNDLTCVIQGAGDDPNCATGQHRVYNYDSLGRLSQETNPESGTTYYSYYTSGPGTGDLYQRTDARNITTTYYYDALHRLTSKTYSDGTPAANYWYDYSSVDLGGWWYYSLTNTKGRLIGACTGPSGNNTNCNGGYTGNSWSYDPMGRVIKFFQATPYNFGSSAWEMDYTFDLAGDITKWTHPAKFTITNQINAAQQFTQVTSSLNDSTHPGTLATMAYNPLGVFSTLTNGCAGSGCTQRQETYDYNNRLQPVRIQLGTSSNNAANYCLVYNYYPNLGSPTSCAVPAQGSSNNDSMIGYYFLDNSDPTNSHNATYQYNSMNQLTGASATTVGSGTITYSQGFNYTGDGTNGEFGNMSCTTGSSGYCPQVTFDPTSNRILKIGSVSAAYDAAGNMTSDGTNSYQWDGEGRLKSMNGVTFTYNALGELARRSNGIQYAWDAAGHQLGTYNDSGVWWEQLIWAGNRQLAYYFPDAKFIHRNYLGSNTMITKYDGSVFTDALFYPWGQIWGVNGDEWRSYFAGFQRYEYDLGIYTPVNRSYFPLYGRWPSPDPAGLGAVDITNPQSLNRYAYVMNNPTTRTDPLGLDGNSGCTPAPSPYGGYYPGSFINCPAPGTNNDPNGEPVASSSGVPDPTQGTLAATWGNALQASYQGPPPSPYGWGLSSANSFLSSAEGGYGNDVGFLSVSCAPSGGLSNSCNPGNYTIGSATNLGFTYVVKQIQNDLLVDQLNRLGASGLLDSPLDDWANFNQTYLRASGLLQYLPTAPGVVPLPKPSSPNACGAIMSQWANALKAWTKEHPGLPPPAWLTVPPATGDCG